MIKFILPYVKDMDARAFPPYQTFLKSQKTFIHRRYNRFLHTFGHESPGVRLLRYILQFVDLAYMDTQSNNYDRYTYHLRFIKRDLEYIFDHARRGRGYRHLFFKQTEPYTEEFLLPVSDTDAVLKLPMSSEKWADWQMVRPLRIWDHDSLEFTTNIIHDQVNFSFDTPSYAVELLDVVALAMKYYIWLKDQRFKEPADELADQAPQQLFLHKYVMCDTIWDLGDIWLLKQLNRLFDYQDDSELTAFDTTVLGPERQYGYVSNYSRRGFEDAWRMFKFTTQNIRPETIFSSKLLFSGSINQRIRLTKQELELPILRQYDWFRFLRDRDMVNIFLKVWRARSYLPITRQMFNYLERDLRRQYLHRPWDQCNNVDLKKQLEQEMLEMYNTVVSIRETD